MKKIIMMISFLLHYATAIHSMMDNKTASQLKQHAELIAPPTQPQSNPSIQQQLPELNDGSSQLTNLLIYGLGGFYIAPHIYGKAFDATGAEYTNKLLKELLPRVASITAATATKFLVTKDYDEAKTSAAIAVGLWIAHVIISLKDNQ